MVQFKIISPFKIDETQIPLRKPSRPWTEKISRAKPPPADAEAYLAPKRRANKRFTAEFFAWQARLISHGDLDERGKNPVCIVCIVRGWDGTMPVRCCSFTARGVRRMSSLTTPIAVCQSCFCARGKLAKLKTHFIERVLCLVVPCHAWFVGIRGPGRQRQVVAAFGQRAFIEARRKAANTNQKAPTLSAFAFLSIPAAADTESHPGRVCAPLQLTCVIFHGVQHRSKGEIGGAVLSSR